MIPGLLSRKKDIRKRWIINAKVTKDFKDQLIEYCERHNIGVSELIRTTIKQKIGEVRLKV